MKWVEKKTLLNAQEMEKVLDRLAQEIAQTLPQPEKIVLVGIQTRGVPLAARLRDRLRRLLNHELPLGSLDITFYRDDLTLVAEAPMVRGSDIPVEITDRTVLLVDDVLFTGRTVRAALEELLDYGRPRYVRLCVLVDRGLRELPICPDFTGLKVSTTYDHMIEVRVKEVDGEDRVLLLQREGVG